LHGRLGWNREFAVQMAYSALLLLIAVIDLEHSLVPNVLVLSGLLLSLATHILSGQSNLRGAVAGASFGGAVFLVLALARRNALGAGDVKLAFLIGMMTGFPGVLQALVLGILLGGLSAAVLLILRLRGPRQYIPYAPYLVAGCLSTLLFGQQIADWYGRFSGLGG
jgi:leader peptidase (prepilin peptidase)/N-methyltransferase